MHHGPPAGKPAWTRYFGVDYNHKVIGIQYGVCLLYTSDAADERSSVDLGGRRIIKKKKHTNLSRSTI